MSLKLKDAKGLTLDPFFIQEGRPLNNFIYLDEPNSGISKNKNEWSKRFFSLHESSTKEIEINKYGFRCEEFKKNLNEYIDKKTMGDHTVYGFIAQQVKEVLPKAVQIVSGIAPNIYKKCDCEGDIIYVIIPQDISLNTEIKLIGDDDQETTYKMLEIGVDYIKIDKVLEVDNIFVYGYNIDDFHRMTKDYIFTVNVCATQILHRRIEEQKEKIRLLENTISNILTRLEAGGL
jgi:hypothetical protein